MGSPLRTVFDAAGKEHRFQYLGTASGLYGEIGPQKFRAVCDRIDGGWQRKARSLRWASLFLAALLLALLLNQVRTGGGIPWPFLLANSLAITSMGIRFFIIRRSLPAAALCVERLRDAMLAEHLCPACAYSLTALESVDSTVACPECGAIWRAPMSGQEQ